MATESSASLLSKVPRFAIWPVVEALTQRTLAAAREGDWVRALRILSERNELVERFFAAPVTKEEAPGVADAVRKILEDDAELSRLSEGGRTEIQEKLRGFKVGRKARQAYLSGL